MKATNRVKMKLRMTPVIIIGGVLLVFAPMSQGFDEFAAMEMARRMHQGQIDLTKQYSQMQGARLRQKYDDFNKNFPNTMTFDEFAYRDMISGGGTNPGAVLQLQQDSFNRLQDSHAGTAGAFADQRAGWQQGQDTLGDIYRNQQHGTMGAWSYTNPYGGSYTLPYSYGPNTYYYGTQPIYQNPAGGYVVPTPSYNYPLYPSW
ncbi:MAG: hypothetical protein QNJ78_15750 [Gammaproteobacteria bacterium]|nr:hypothetical protein [Gammaproteobacteria bacterium]